MVNYGLTSSQCYLPNVNATKSPLEAQLEVFTGVKRKQRIPTFRDQSHKIGRGSMAHGHLMDLIRGLWKSLSHAATAFTLHKGLFKVKNKERKLEVEFREQSTIQKAESYKSGGMGLCSSAKR